MKPELICTDIFDKYFTRVPLDYKDLETMSTTHAIFASVYLITPSKLHLFMEDMEKRIEDHVFEKIRNMK